MWLPVYSVWIDPIITHLEVAAQQTDTLNYMSYLAHISPCP